MWSGSKCWQSGSTIDVRTPRSAHCSTNTAAHSEHVLLESYFVVRVVSGGCLLYNARFSASTCFLLVGFHFAVQLVLALYFRRSVALLFIDTIMHPPCRLIWPSYRLCAFHSVHLLKVGHSLVVWTGFVQFQCSTDIPLYGHAISMLISRECLQTPSTLFTGMHIYIYDTIYIY